ncbi:MAG: CBS domain-containing protein [Xenococcus sp. MO_188.B8]|nr:CBS domain-containing protein [Xenococcus sp. MO_188.B8]
MEFNHNFFTTPDLETTIDRHPLIMPPEMPLQKAIAMMSQAWGSSCALSAQEQSLEEVSRHQVRSSCALIMKDEKILGILTERDIVKLTASGIVFADLSVAEVMTHPVVTLNENNFPDIFAALFLFRRYRIRHLPLVDSNAQLLGVISPVTIRDAMRPANLLKLRRVADVMSRKVVTATPDHSIKEIAQLMAENHVSCVIIVSEEPEREIKHPEGIITERDIIQFQTLQLSLEQILAIEVMSAPLFLLSPEDSLLAAHQEMKRKKIRRLVVSWNWGKGLGIVTQTSLLKIFDPMEMYTVIESLQHTVQKLQQENQELLNKIRVAE